MKEYKVKIDKKVYYMSKKDYYERFLLIPLTIDTTLRVGGYLQSK